jgi:Protein containing a metal-binding domain shared with formylmethanofuran dehydrogenase subunit E
MALVLVCLLCLPVMAALPDGNRMEQLGERAAYTAMDQLQFAKGDPDVMVLTNAGRAVVEGQTTERVLSGITEVSGLQNGDNTLWTVNRADWKPLWFYFYDKDTGKGLYLIPDTSFYTMSDAELGTVPYSDTFSTNKLVTGDIYQMLADTRAGNETEKALGGEAFSIVSITNAWAHGAPYDLMSAAMLHNHLCPGLLGGYIPIKYAEKVLPITDSSSSYLYVTTSTSCKEDAFPILWDMTPAKGGAVVAPSLSDNETAVLKAKYGANPSMIIVRWDSKAKTGTGIVLGSVAQNSTEQYTGPEWGAKPYRVVKAMDTINQPELSVKTLRTFSVDQNMYSELRKSTNNPYNVIGDL